MVRRILVGCALFVFAAIPALADDKVDVKKLKGKWEREVDGNKLVFQFKDDKTMSVFLTPSGANDAVEVSCDYKLGDDGVVSLTIVKLDKKGVDIDADKDDSFSFKVEAGKDTITLSDLKGSKVNDTVKQIVEGEYKKKVD
ncbi:MAG TPA: hypothetical protein VKS79_14935 [Gemmataceae bacterium]|nr:hypothetical protein [Gemmataceae bacterium]